MKNTLDTILTFLFFYWIILSLLKIILSAFKIYDKVSINIKLPKNKYLKDGYLYYYTISEVEGNNYYIKKFVLKPSNDNFITFILLLIFPWPINVYNWQYCLEHKFLKIYDDISHLTYNDISKVYEDAKSILLEKYNLENETKNLKIKNINRINNMS